MGRLRELHPRRFFLETWGNLNEKSALGLRAINRRIVGVLLLAAVSLATFELGANRRLFERLFGHLLEEGGRYNDLAWHAYWAGLHVVAYLILPALLIAALRLGGPADFGLGRRGVFQHLWIYVLLFLAVLPAVVIASFTEEFHTYYPFYVHAGRSRLDFLAWETFYGLQFFCIEFFFRGFLLFGLARVLGAYAIFVMAIPYCMIHFSKPPLEAFGAILAGVVLGTLALRTRSIWCGFLIHISVALTMDIASLAQRGDLGRLFGL